MSRRTPFDADAVDAAEQDVEEFVEAAHRQASPRVSIYSVGMFAADCSDPSELVAAISDKHGLEVHSLVSALKFKRARDAAPLKHVGTHFDNVRTTVQTTEFKTFVRAIRVEVELHCHMKPGKDMNLLLYCNNGRHRSVLGADALARIMRKLKYNVRGPVHLSRENWKAMCSTCDHCKESAAKTEFYDSALQFWE